jgi:hypothetical protein
MTILQELTTSDATPLLDLIGGDGSTSHAPLTAGWDNQPTWDNKPAGGGWDNRPTWDNWSKK